MTGKNQFYEMFNVVYPLLVYRDEKPAEYNSLALQEAFNGPFTLATLFMCGGELDEVLKIKEKFKIPNRKICIIDVYSKFKGSSLEDLILNNNYRYFSYERDNIRPSRFLDLLGDDK